MGHPADVPQLQKDRASMTMNLISHQTPAIHLGFRVDSGCPRVTVTGLIHVGGLGNDQAGTGPLAIILRDQFVREVTIGRAVALGCPRAGHGRHDDAVLQRNRAAKQLSFEQLGHRSSSEQVSAEGYCSVVIPNLHTLWSVVGR